MSAVLTRRRAVASVAVLAVALGVAWGVRWWLTAPAFGPGGAEIGGPGQVGQTYVGIDIFTRDTPTPLTLDITSVRPRIVTNTSHARVRVVLCHRRQLIPTFGFLPLAQARRHGCAGLTPLRPGRHAFSKHGADIWLEVTPTSPGRVEISGVQLSYWRGIRHGHELDGFDLTMHTP